MEKVKKRKIIGISIFFVIVISISFFVIKSLNKEKVREENSYSRNETTYFEEVGHYGIAYRGCNNAYRGTGVDTGVRLLCEYPPNGDEIAKNMPESLLSRINNITGACLNFNGIVKKAWITTMVSSSSIPYNYDILVIRPDGSYQVISKGSCQTIPISITQSGMYYVSILDAPVQPQLAWVITAVYENSSLPNKYICLNYAPYIIAGTDTENYRDILSINFQGAFSTAFKDSFELYGVVIGGGLSGWSVAGQTEDKLEVKLSDGTYKQLYRSYYNGRDYFAERSKTDFFNGNFYGTRITTSDYTHIPNNGGEMDVFYENVPKGYFGNRDVNGYRVTKNGANVIMTQLFGIGRELAYPNILISSEITNQTQDKLIENEKTHIKINITNNSVSDNRSAYKSTITCKIDNALSSIENLVVKIDGVESSVVPTYNSTTNEVTINNIAKILPGQVVTLEYDATINSNIQNKGAMNTSIELPINVNVKTYSVDINSLNSTYQNKYSNSYNETKGTVNVTGVYTAKSEGVEVKYIDEITGEEIGEKEEILGFQGEEYTTEEREISGYELTVIPTNKVGTMTEDKITVVYKYRKVSNVIVKYIDLNNGDEIEKQKNLYKEGENYTTYEKEIDGYRLIIIPENKEGIVEREDIVVEYGYKKIVIGVEVKYIDEITNEEIEIKEQIKGIEGDNYTTNAKEVSGYELVETPINTSGVMREDTTTVTYKYRKLSKVIVRYVDKNSSEEFDRVEKTYKQGDNYETNEKEIPAYKLVETPTNANGVVGREDIEVVYEYSKIAGGIEVKYIDEVTNEEIVTSEHEVGLVGEEYLIEQKEISGYELIGVPENAKGIMSEEKITVTYKYRKLSKVIVSYIDKASNKEIEREEIEYKEGDSYKVDKKEFYGYKYIETVGKAEGVVERSNIEVKYYYEREKVLVKVEINIVDENGNIIETIEKEGYIGDVEEIVLPEIDGYYIEDKAVTIEYGKSNNINITYKKKIFNLPNTSDINIYVYIGIFVVSIVGISYISFKNRENIKK